jgi:hypothetical protein
VAFSRLLLRRHIRAFRQTADPQLIEIRCEATILKPETSPSLRESVTQPMPFTRVDVELLIPECFENILAHALKNMIFSRQSSSSRFRSEKQHRNMFVLLIFRQILRSEKTAIDGENAPIVFNRPNPGS